jgi:hypothetical protein
MYRYRELYYSIVMNSLIRNFIARVNSLVVTPSVAVTAATPVLGRWGIQYDEKVIDRKIIQANEDHCGCCVDVRSENPKNEREEAATSAKKNSSVMRYEKTEEYLLPYVM